MAGEVGGRYRLLELVGVGGMGRVWRAEDTLLQRTVAVKEILTASEPVREARAAARLNHPGVVKVYDILTVAGRSWIVMEYMASRSLHQAVSDDGPLPPDEVARIGLRMVAALRKAHAAGVLHRDVKPDNVLLALDGRVVLSDFGLATIAGLDGPDPRLGSPSYMAPERLLSRETGVAGDLWSLGATLYYAVEGRRPFRRDDGGTALRALIDEPPDPFVLAGELGPLLLALLDKAPERRPSAAEVEDRLTALIRSGAVPGPTRVDSVSAPTRVDSVCGPKRAGSVRGRARVRRRSSRLRLALAGSAVLVAVTAGAAVAAAGAGPGSRPAVLVQPSAAAPALMSYQVDACGLGGSGRAVAAATGDVPAGLPEGWVWFRDPAGFALALPAGWQRSAGGDEVCFTDPSGRRAFTVNVSAVVTPEPLAYWQNREKTETARGELPGYQRISMGVLLFRRGAADWEYTWRPGSETPRRERRVLVPVSGSRPYLLRWTVSDSDWAPSTTLQRRLVDFFCPAA